MRQFTFQPCQSHVFSLAHFPFGFLDESALFTGEHVVGINHSLGLDEYSTGPGGECHKIAFLQLERFADTPRNHHLAPLADLTERLLNCRGCFGSHIFRLSDCQKLSRPEPVSPTPVPDPRWCLPRL